MAHRHSFVSLLAAPAVIAVATIGASLGKVQTQGECRSLRWRRRQRQQPGSGGLLVRLGRLVGRGVILRFSHPAFSCEDRKQEKKREVREAAVHQR